MRYTLLIYSFFRGIVFSVAGERVIGFTKSPAL